MSDRVLHYTKDGVITAGNRYAYFSFDTDTLLDGNATYIFDIIITVHQPEASYSQGGRWMAACRRDSGALIALKYQPQKFFVTAEVSVSLTWVKSGDTIDFTYDNYYDAGNKWWRVWMDIYGKDNTV